MDDWAHWRASLSDAASLDVLTTRISGDASGQLDDADVAAVADELCVALTVMLADPFYGAPTSHSFVAVRDLCVQHLPVFLAALARMIND